MHRYIKFGFILILILFIAFSDINISYAYSVQNVSDASTHTKLDTLSGRVQNILNVIDRDITYYVLTTTGLTTTTGKDNAYKGNLSYLVGFIAQEISSGSFKTQINSIANSAALSDQKLNDIYYAVDGIETSISSSNTSLSSILSEIEEQNNIVWTNLSTRTNTNLKYYISDEPISDISSVFDDFIDIPESVVTIPKDKYLYISFLNSANLGGSAIVRFVLPLNGQVGNNEIGRVFTKVTTVYGELDSSYFYFGRSSSDQRGAFYRFFPGGNSGRHFNSYYILEFLPNYQYQTNLNVISDAPNTTDAITFDGNDKNVLETMNLFNELYFYKAFNKLVDIYASDDVSTAKKEQQEFEDQALNDFTGSGTAASSTDDINSLKNVSNTLKDGINTGGSVNNALSVFSDSSSIWDWFKQDNYNNINNQYNSNSNRLLRSNSGSDDIIDFYSQNQNEVFESLGD